MSNTFYVARTDGLAVVACGAHSDRWRTEDAVALRPSVTEGRDLR